MNQLLRYLRAALPASPPAGESDRELLARFARQRDPSAFAALVSRHGGAVWAACRRLLDREQDAEDAFQAVFLTLARKAGSVGDSLPAWLHGVARRVAANLRRDQRRRIATEDAARVPEGRSSAEVSLREGLAILDEELARLPDRYRAVLIACCLDGRSRDEAARQLGCTEGQVKGLLERGRELLRQRLSRRGIDFGAVLLAATVANGAVAAPGVAVEAALRVAQGEGVAGLVSPAVVALSERVVGAMLIQKLKAVAVVLVVSAVAVGGAFTHPAAGGTDPIKKDDRAPGHAFAPQGGRAVTDDPLMPPSKPLVPGQPGGRNRDPFAPGNGPGPAGPVKEKSIPPAEPVPSGKIDPKWLRELGNRFDVEVTGRTDGFCAGTDLYLHDSDLGTAAVHAGLVKAGEKAVITITVVKCPKSSEGSTRNGVKSLPWDGATAADTALVLQRIPKENRAAEKEPDVLTIEQAALAKPDRTVKVMFEVASLEVEDIAPNEPREWRVITLNPKERLANGRKFRVHLMGQAVTPLFNLGLVRADPMRGPGYFPGKTVRVTGKVVAIEDPNPNTKGTDYRIIVSELGDLMVK